MKTGKTQAGGQSQSGKNDGPENMGGPKGRPYYVRVVTQNQKDKYYNYSTYAAAKTKYEELVTEYDYSYASSRDDYAIDLNNEDNWIELGKNDLVLKEGGYPLGSNMGSHHQTSFEEGGSTKYPGWKASEKFGSFYKIHPEGFIQVPMMLDGTMALDEFENNGSPEEVNVDSRAFSENEEQGFADEMVRLFGPKAYDVYPVKYFKNIKKLSAGGHPVGSGIQHMEHKDTTFEQGGPIGTGKNGYIAFYKGKQVEVMADSSYAAQKKAAEYFKAKKSYEVTVVLAEKDGQQVTHVPDFSKGGHPLGSKIMQHHETSFSDGGKPEITYEIRGYKSLNDYEHGNGDDLDDGIISKTEALAVGKHFFRKQYDVVRIQSNDGEYVKIFQKDDDFSKGGHPEGSGIQHQEHKDTTFDKGGSADLKILHKGRYITLATQNRKLHIFLTQEGKEWIEENGPVTYDNFWELFDDVQGNSDMMYFDDLGNVGIGLTSAPGFTEGFYYDDHGGMKNHKDARVWWYPDYAVKDPFEELTKEGEVDFEASPNNKFEKGGHPEGSGIQHQEHKDTTFEEGGIVNPNWFVEAIDDNNVWIMDSGTGKTGARYLAEIVSSDEEEKFVKDPNERMKIARLMAMAPDLLRMVKKVCYKLQEHQTKDTRIIKGYTLAANVEGLTELLNEATRLLIKWQPFEFGGQADEVSGHPKGSNIGHETSFEEGGHPAGSGIQHMEHKDTTFKEGGKTMKRIPNSEANIMAENHIPFKGSNLEGKTLDNGDYVVLSYGHYPLWYYNSRDKKWFTNTSSYCQASDIHKSQSKPAWDATPLSHEQLLEQMRTDQQKFDMGGALGDLVQPHYPNISVASSGLEGQTSGNPVYPAGSAENLPLSPG